MKKDNDATQLKAAINGDILAFQELYASFQNQLRSYLYRLTASRADADDLNHDTFIKAFTKLDTFTGNSSLKTWVFQIATHLAYDHLRRRKRWTPDVSAQAKALVLDNEVLRKSITKTNQESTYGIYEIKEHIATCFTCIGKNLPLENQIVLMLKDIYDFSVKEIMQILNKTEGVVKYLLQTARKTMTSIFEQRCALINKEGVCHQCSELNHWFNPKQNQQEALMKVKFARQADQKDQQELYQLRAQLVKAIDPLKSEGNELQQLLLDCNRMAMGELAVNE